MDNSIIYSTDACSDYIYSDDYLNFLIKYDGDLQGVYDRVNPDCVTIVNSQFLVAYKNKSTDIRNQYLQFGYNSLPKCYGLMDMTALIDTGADRVRSLPGLSLTGRGTMIGFVDTGIDYTNSLFLNPDGTTRILSIWDQTSEVFGTGQSVFGYGAEYTADTINRALKSENPYSIVPSRDVNGHGTFLASVAAGGEDVDGSFSGMAPLSELVVVKLKQVKKDIRDFFIINETAECYGEDDIFLAVKYLITKAIEQKKPMIICVGLGTNQGDHNGSTNLELYFDTIVNLRGICVVSAGGNELGSAGHYSGNRQAVSDIYQDSIEINVGANDRGFSMEIWGNSPGLLKLGILSPTGELFDDISPIQDEETMASFIYEGTEVYIENVVVDGTTGDPMIFLRFDKPTQGIWTVNVKESLDYIGRGFDAWLPIRNFLNSDTSFVRPDPNVTLCAPGNSRGTITVAGFNHESKALYVHSSRGYTRKGIIKPDIAAPSVNVYGAFARSTGVVGSQSLYTRMDGTSVGAAFVAGAATLIMEWAYVRGNNPGINTETIKQMLIRGAKQIADVSYPNRAWGWGALDIYGVFDVMRNI